MYQEHYAISDWTMTALYAAYVASCIPALVLFGSAADALGRKPVLLAAIGCAGVGTLLFAVSSIGIIGLFAGRILLGIGLGLGTGAGIALMVEASPNRVPWLGSTAATISFVLGAGAGPIFTGAVTTLDAGVMTTHSFLLVGVLFLTVVLVFGLRMHRPSPRHRWRPTRHQCPARCSGTSI